MFPSFDRSRTPRRRFNYNIPASVVLRSKLGGHSELGEFGGRGVQNWERNRAVKTKK